MSDLPNEVTRFFQNLADDDEGAETLAKQLAPRTFVFELDDGKPFVLNASLEDVSCEWGTIESPDLVNDVTRVETDTDTLYAMMRGQVSPLDALNDGDLFMSSMMTARCYNYGLLRAFRRGGEMTSRAQTSWQT